MAGLKCPFCGQIMSINSDTHIEHIISFTKRYASHLGFPMSLIIHEYRCPNEACEKRTLVAKGVAEYDFAGFNEMIWPRFQCEHFPDFVPETIRKDYEEACAVRSLSPKASATLSRRCLQGMIRDFWGINKRTLYDEINALSGKVDQTLIDALLSMKSIGNIGAHPEPDVNLMVDVDPDEAESLIQLIEILVAEWYIARDTRSKAIQKVNETANQKEILRKGLDS